MSGALFPVLATRSSWLHVPKAVFDFAKYFGSGVIIATAFIHLLSPAIEELASPCLSPAWQEYPYPLALALLSVFSIFIVELVAFRWGTAKLAALGLSHDAHGHGLGALAAHGPEGGIPNDDSTPEKSKEDLESAHDHKHLDLGATGQIIGVFILEFGVLLHSMLIGLTLAVDPNFKILFVVIVFHQSFEGLGVGTRLAHLQLPPKYNYVAICGALLTYNPNSTTASIVSGVLDSLSAGILLYTGLVELLAHEFIFNKEMINGSNGRVAYALSCMLFGCGIMALPGALGIIVIKSSICYDRLV
ncbi:Zinc/iron permease [Suillus subalutaceus]|uniref:Zinc/iron permease n=1 Tax=Suillus subalutaceus TaxID=48586 RepID=UPI001B87161A|nr:Zinc/iron permease [Suillus subalutaceus]KAG1864982.1 Zinc/iron permease [Suillus subalutaceus]